MLSSCLNESCRAPFRYFREGRIFKVERVVPGGTGSEPQRLVEHYWLCDICSLHLKVIVENGCVATQSIQPELLTGKPSPDAGGQHPDPAR